MWAWVSRHSLLDIRLLWGGNGSEKEVKGEQTWELVGMNVTAEVK